MEEDEKTWKNKILRDLGKMTEQVIEWVNPYFKTVKIRGEKETKRKKNLCNRFHEKKDKMKTAMVSDWRTDTFLTI